MADDILFKVLFEETLPPGAAWSHILKRGTALRLTDTDGGANVGALLYNADCPVERLNIPDTLKAQHIARLMQGFVLYSDMGRVLCSMTEDSLGWHDALSGCLDAAAVNAKYGKARYQEHRNNFHRNARDSFLIELEKYGLGARDLSPNINFFSKVSVENSGALAYQPSHSPPGGVVELRAEMNVLLILSSCPHPLDPSPHYAPKPVHLSLRRVPPPAADDPCRISRPGKRARFHSDGALFPMSDFHFVPSTLSPADAVYSEIISAGESWIHPIAEGQTFRIVDLEGNQAVDTLFYNAHDYADRYDFQNTIRAQGNIYLTAGSRLMSSLGNVLLTITADTCGRHDTLGGACATESNQVRYALDKGYMHACRQSFLSALLRDGKGLEKRDIPNNINFFMNVPVTPDGGLTFEDGISEAGKYVEMRAERDVLGLLSNCPQLNNPCNAYNPTPIQVLIWDAHVS